VLRQGAHRFSGEDDGAAAAIRLRLEADPLAIEAGKGGGDGDLTNSQVDVAPSESENLTLTEPGGGCQDIEGMESVGAGGIQKTSTLGRR
jgi:hypothetical protein